MTIPDSGAEASSLPPAQREPFGSRDWPRIYSRRKGAQPAPPDAVYVGRPSPWANPHPIRENVSPEWSERNRVCELFDREQRHARELDPVAWSEWIDPLRGKSLVCWCRSPWDAVKKRCHAETLLRMASDVWLCRWPRQSLYPQDAVDWGYWYPPNNRPGHIAALVSRDPERPDDLPLPRGACGACEGTGQTPYSFMCAPCPCCNGTGREGAQNLALDLFAGSEAAE